MSSFALRSANRLVRAILFLLLACAVGSPGGAGAADAKHALLVGCTRYQLANISELWGPGNDIPRVRDLLIERFGFPRENVRVLVGGWQDEPRSRPSYANIAAAFKELVARTQAGDQVVILLSGHGSRIPIAEPSEKQGWKAHSLAFLPVDVQEWNNNKIDNALVDDELKGRLDQLRAKKVRVLILFDCCHSGSMTRGIERMRTVHPQALGVPARILLQSVERAREGFQEHRPRGERGRGGPELLPHGLGLEGGAGGKEEGNVTAFYACQPWEETPELPRPADAPQVQENYYGLLTWTLISVLEQQGKGMTYRELGQALALRYRADRGSRGPAPFFEGDLDAEVLGVRRWPGRSAILLQKDGDRLRLSAGELMGLTRDSVLEVHPPRVDRDKRESRTILGYVRATKVGAGQAEVEPCRREDRDAVAADKLPDGAVCEVVERGLGRMRLTLAVSTPHPAIAAALKALASDADFKDLFEIVKEEGKADWLLSSEGDRALLWQGIGARLDAEAMKRLQEADEDQVALGQPKKRRQFGGYPLNDVRTLEAELRTDLHKIYTWNSLWKIAASSGAGSARGEGLRLEVWRRKKDDSVAGLLPSGSALRSGQSTELRLTNKGRQDLWVTLIALDADCGVNVVHLSLAAGDVRKLPGRIESPVEGQEGMVVLAFPMDKNSQEPRFDFLQQLPLKEVGQSRGKDVPAPEKDPATPFRSLMKTARVGKGTRAFVFDAPSNPVVLSWTWTVYP